MPNFQLEISGKIYEVEAPDQATALAALQGAKVQPTEAAIPQGDWGALKDRIDAAVKKERGIMGPVREQDLQEVAKQEAARQGKLYGQQQGAQESGLGVGLGAAANQYGMGLPRLLEAYAGQNTLPGAQAHEFLKAADAGRAEARPGAALAGTIGGVVGQVASLPVSGAATLGGRALSAANQAGTTSLVESLANSRGDIKQALGAGAVGFAIGGAGSAAGEKLIQTGRTLIDPLRGLAKSGPVDTQATARVILAAKKAGLDDAAIQKGLADLGPEGFLADVMGKYGQSLARTSSNLSPEARTILENASSGRVANQQQRLVAALEGASGATAGQTTDDLTKAIYEAAKPQVNAAYIKAKTEGVATPLEHPGWMQNSPLVQEALAYARNSVRNRVAARGEGEGSQFSLLDTARQYLAKKAQNYADPDAAVAGELAKKLNGYIDEAISSAPAARGLAQQYKQAQAATEAGAGLAKVTPDAEALKVAQAGKNPNEIAKGFGAAKIEDINRRMPGKRTVDIIDGSPSQKQALLAALRGNAGQVSRQASAERKFLEFENALKGNSTTARQLAEMGIITGAGAAGGYLTGFDPMQAGSVAGLAALGRRGVGKIMEALASRNEAAVAPEVAKRLIERSLPKLTDASGKPLTETARRRLVEVLLMQGQRAAAIGYGTQ